MYFFAYKGPSSQGYGFSSSHVWKWKLDHKESWMQKNWCFWTVVLEKALESPLVCKEIQPVHLKGNKYRIFIGRTDAEAEVPLIWPPDEKNWLIGKDPDARKNWGQEEKGMTKDEMVGWLHWLDWHGFGWTPGVGNGQGSLACRSPWGPKELDMTEQLSRLILGITYSNFVFSHRRSKNIYTECFVCVCVVSLVFGVSYFFPNNWHL